MIRYSTIFSCMAMLLGIGGTAVAEQPESSSALRLYVFECGRVRFDSMEGFSIEDDETDVRELIVPCYIIEHEKGRMLWDGGLPSATAETKGWQGEGMQLRLDRTLAEQMAEINLNMSSFDLIAFSHMHFDHVGVANEVEGATLLIQKTEYEAAFADKVNIPAVKPAIYSKLKDAKRVLLEGDYDVFGDGKVRIISAPGHTPGHQVLFLDLANTGPIVLSGDLYHLAISRRERRVPTFNTDAQATLKSMDRVEAFLKETGAHLWIEHELAWFEQLEKSPSSYD